MPISRNGIRVFIVGCCVGGAPSFVSAQCPDWRVRGSGIHVAGYVYAQTPWDPDGAGPQPPLLVVGGDFTRIGGVGGTAANNIAAWNGTAWQALGSGIDSPSASVYALGVFNGELIAGGHFSSAGGAAASNCARWNGTAWQPVGVGPTGFGYDTVKAFTVFNGELIAGGFFFQADGVTTNNIARWNGTAWRALGSGTDDEVTSLAVFNGELIAGGDFNSAGGVPANSIAAWNGTSWHTLGGGLQGTAGLGGGPVVLSLLPFGGALFVGGNFATAGGQAASCIAKWTGTAWLGVVGGMTGGDFPGVSALAAFQGEVVACGQFTSAGGQPAKNIARLSGAAWLPLGSGVTSSSPTGSVAYSMSVFNNELFAGGFFLNAGGTLAQGLGRWNGTAWVSTAGALRPSGEFGVRCIMPWAGMIVLGGFYPAVDTNLFASSENLIGWDGREFRELGNPNGFVHAAATSPVLGTTDLIVGGDFTSIGGVAANRIARVNDTAAGPGGTAWQPMGSGFNSDVYAITRFNGSIYAAGGFTASGASPVDHIARFNGTSWLPVGPGAVKGTNASVYAVKGFSSGATTVDLVVGGAFTSAGGVAAGSIATYRESTQISQSFWLAMGPGFNGPVYAVERFNGSTYAAGDFTASGTTPLHNIARWNGTAWEDVGGGTNQQIRAMTVSNGTLVVGGFFTTAGPFSANRLARWNGTAWAPIGGGLNGAVRALGSFHNEIQVGGEFTRVRLDVLESPIWARFSEDGIPWFAAQPISTTANCGANASFSIHAAEGYGGLVYQWRKNGTAVGSGPTGTGSTILTNGVNFTIQNVTPADAGTYDCVLSNACGGTTSSPAVLTVNPCPVCDVNCDGAVNALDAQKLVQFLLDPAAARCSATAGDLNGDTAVDAIDIQPLVGCLIP